MKIYDLNLTGGSGASQAGRAQQTQQTEQSASAQAARQAGGSSDRVEFSSALGRLSQALATDGQARSERVQQLAAQYRSGNYQPDSAATSHAMVSELLAAGR